MQAHLPTEGRAKKEGTNVRVDRSEKRPFSEYYLIEVKEHVDEVEHCRTVGELVARDESTHLFVGPQFAQHTGIVLRVAVGKYQLADELGGVDLFRVELNSNHWQVPVSEMPTCDPAQHDKRLSVLKS